MAGVNSRDARFCQQARARQATRSAHAIVGAACALGRAADARRASFRSFHARCASSLFVCASRRFVLLPSRAATAMALAPIPLASGALLERSPQGAYPNRPIRMVVTFPPGGAPMCWRAFSVRRWASCGASRS